MLKIKFDQALMYYIKLFQQVTGVDSKDCFYDSQDLLTFIVEESQVGKAVGKGAVNIKKLETKLKRKIKIIGFNPDVIQFIKNCVFPLQIKEIQEEDGIVTVDAADTKTRGLLIGRGAANLRNTESIVKRYHQIKEIKVNQ